MKTLKLALVAVCAIVLAVTTAEAQTLRWWHHMHLEGAQGKLFQKYANEFEAANPGVKIEIHSVPPTQQTVTVEPRRQHITFAPFTAPDRMSILILRLAIGSAGYGGNTAQSVPVFPLSPISAVI